MEVKETLPDPRAFAARFRQIEENVERVIRGKHQEIRLALVALVAEGHLLIEDVPGVGKTMLAKAIARSFDCFVPPDPVHARPAADRRHRRQRLQPGDRASSSSSPGRSSPTSCSGDEINRATPKTQSALLECMEERQVTVDGETHTLGTPFMVIATQNPIEHEGTYPLPEAQLDRFMMRLAIGYPDPDVAADILATHVRHSTSTTSDP